MFGIKIESDENIPKYISLIRKYDKYLSIADIRSRIFNNDYVVDYDFYSSYDVCDDLNDIDRGELFRQLLDNLMSVGAKLTIYDDDEEISLEFLDNCFQMYKEIEQEVLLDMEREVTGEPYPQEFYEY